MDNSQERRTVDKQAIEKAVREILIAIGEDPDREGLVGTPDRVARMYEEIFSGLHEDPRKHLKVLFKNENHEENFYTLQYLYHMLQCMDNIPEIKYMLAYLSKLNGFTPANVFRYNEDKQFTFEGIMYSAFTLYDDGRANKAKVTENRNRFVEEIESRNEEVLSRTQQLSTVRIQALRELGYDEINASNAAEVFEKIAEIQTRGV